MRQMNIQLNEFASFDWYPVWPQTADERLPLILVLPGGGYLYTSPRESEPVALRINTNYMHALVLHYTTATNRHIRLDELLNEVNAVINWVQEHALAYQIDLAKVSVMGFSAGGNLAAHCSSLLTDVFYKAILAYPATSFPRATEEELTEKFHNMFSRVAGPDANEERIRRTMTDLLAVDPTAEITARTRPTFIFQTNEDMMVDPHATVQYCMTLMEHQVPCEMVLYQKGAHGLSLADETCNPVLFRHQAKWFDQAMEWLAD